MIRTKFIGAIALLLVALSASAIVSLADHGPSREPLSALKRAITAANAPALTAQQETDLTTLITTFKNALPTEPDAALVAAREAYDAAILAGNLTAAQTAATAIATRQAQLSDVRLKAEAAFEITVLANLQTGGQLAPLAVKYDDERILDIVGSLVGHGGGPGGGPGGGRRGL
jgi:hypothetical protein